MKKKKADVPLQDDLRTNETDSMVEINYTSELLMRGMPDPSVWTIAQQFARAYQWDRLETLRRYTKEK